EDVRRSLLEALRVSHQYFFPPDPAQCCQYRQRDWSPVAGASSNAVSYGHNVEFAWMLIRAETVLGLPPSWELFYAHLDHALRNGYDDRRGGAYHPGLGNQPATRTEKGGGGHGEPTPAPPDAPLPPRGP